LSQRYTRLLLVIVAVVCCLLAMRSAIAYGASRLLVIYSLTTGNAAGANKASQLTPRDAEVYVAKAGMLSLAREPAAALVELERAIALRPSDFRIWSGLGLLRDQVGDTAGSLVAYEEAIKRAPHYSQPLWNRGNVLLRAQRYDEAFRDLNAAAKSNPDLIPNLVDLAWGLSKGDAALAEQLAQIDGDAKRIAFARLLARQGKADLAVAQFRTAHNVPSDVKTELIDQLLGKHNFTGALVVWNDLHGVENTSGSTAAIFDGGFEGGLSFGERGFGWRVPANLPATSVSLDAREPHSGAKSLRVDVNGVANAGWLSQLILVEPARRYQVNFASRSQEIVTGGLPFLSVTDAVTNQQQGRSQTLGSGTTGWKVYTLEFTTGANTSAVLLSVQREDCTTSPCPIFGSLSFDSFSLAPLR
jgi:tetratricopeptide (TPR) repeat protein